MIRMLLVMTVLGCGQLGLATRANATIMLCGVRASAPVGHSYAIKNGNFAGVPQCVSSPGSGAPRCTVTLSRANTSGIEPLSYPEIFVGCTWGTCSPDSPLPARLDTLHDPVTSWQTAQPARGTWNTAYDIWFDRYPLRNGQADGAEMMIWLNSKGTASSAGSPVVLLDHSSWHLLTWIARGHGKHWRYIALRKVDPAVRVSHLELTPFFAFAESRGWISRNWYLLDVSAGFEIWRGGSGLATHSFAAQL
jgi:hypothetical protein